MKKSLQFLTACAFAAALMGCTKAQLVRFAPPGVIKYENLAGDEPANPEIQARIAERAGEGDERFPILSETPAERPVRPPARQVEGRIARLEAARDGLDAAIADERVAAQAEREAQDPLPASRDELLREIERQSAAAARERRTPMPEAQGAR